MIGTVKCMSPRSGFGFITAPDVEGDIFVHYTDINAAGFRMFAPGDKVEFEIERGPKGYRARKVHRSFAEAKAACAGFCDIEFLIIMAVLIVALLAIVAPPWFESRAYNRLTGAQTTYWDAVWLDLRVQESPKEVAR